MRDKEAQPAARCTAVAALVDRVSCPAKTTEITLRKDFGELDDAELIAIAAGADDEVDAPTETRAH